MGTRVLIENLILSGKNHHESYCSKQMPPKKIPCWYSTFNNPGTYFPRRYAILWMLDSGRGAETSTGAHWSGHTSGTMAEGPAGPERASPLVLLSDSPNLCWNPLLDLGPISTSESPFSLQQRWWKTFYLPPRVVVWINVMMSIKGLCSVWNTVNARKAKLILNPTIKITHYLLCTRLCSECFICISALQISIITSEESATSKGTHLHLQVAKLGLHPACPCLCLNHSGCHWEDRSH